MTLRWIQGDRYYIRSECGRFTVCKTFTREVPTYTAWRLTRDIGGRVTERVILLTAATAAACQSACEAA